MKLARDGQMCLPAIGNAFAIFASQTVGFSGHRERENDESYSREPQRGRWILVCAALALLLLAPRPLLANIPPSVKFGCIVTTMSTTPDTLISPLSVAVDSSGNVYIADVGNNRIVKINAAGVASVLAITGLSPALAGATGVAVDATGLLYITDSGNSRIVTVDSTGAGSVLSTGGITLNSPQAVLVDAAGNIFISDTPNNRIVKVVAGVASVLSITGLDTALGAPGGLAERTTLANNGTNTQNDLRIAFGVSYRIGKH